MRRFPLSLRPSPLPYTDQGSTPGPPMLCFLIWNRRSVSEFSSAEFGGFGLGRLVSNGILDAKAGHSDQHFGCLCNLGLSKKLRFSLQRHKSSRQYAGVLWRDLADFRIAGDLHSKPRKSLCDRIPLTFATVSRCLHSLTFGRHDRFCVW